MKIKSMRIERFRGFEDVTIDFNPLTCFVGVNGSGKSTVLAALNVFFCEQSGTHTDVAKLGEEDYFAKDTSSAVRITLTFADLSPKAESELAAYARHGEITVTAEAVFNPSVGYGHVRHIGHRLGMAEFRPFFDAEKRGESGAVLAEIFSSLRATYPEIDAAKSKEARAAALQAYEVDHKGDCVLIASEDMFYGINSTGKLAEFVQWVYVPAVKDAGEEAQESKNTALGKLIARAVLRTALNAEIDTLREDAWRKYQDVLDRNQKGLTDLGESLERRLAEWAHPDVELDVAWLSDPKKSVVMPSPVAGITTGEGGFIGSLARMGHGLQRSYLLALLQELAGSDEPNAPTLLLGCEEPELYQHPPQARHLADVLEELTKGNNQVALTTHSPLFVSGKDFENVRVVRRPDPKAGATVCGLTLDRVCQRLRECNGEDPERDATGLIAKIHQSLQPGIAEMLFAHVPVFVEGLEDVAYITTQLHLEGLWTEFRRRGCHLVAMNGKSAMIRPLAIAVELGLPVFSVFDADGNETNESRRPKHEKDNKALLALLGAEPDPFPDQTIWAANHVVWPANLTETVKGEFADGYERYTEPVRVRYAHEADLEKNSLFIAAWMTAAYRAGDKSASLTKLCQTIIAYAGQAKLDAEVAVVPAQDLPTPPLTATPMR